MISYNEIKQEIMQKKFWFLTILIILLPNCSGNSGEKRTLEKNIYNLDESTDIILKLIHTQKLSDILIDSTEENVDLLIRNFSPAEIAFESEVLNCTLPAVLIFFKKNDSNLSEIKIILDKMASEYTDKIKFVEIDVDRLIKIAQNGEVTNTPTILIVANREERSRIGNFSVNNIESLLNPELRNYL